MKSNEEIMEIMGLIRQIHIRMSRYYLKMLNEYDMTIQHYTLLLLPIYQGTLRMNEIASKLAVTNPAVTNLVDQLEQKGLIKRLSCEEDRRVTLIEITDEGRSLVEKIQEISLALFSRTFAAFDTDTRAKLKTFFTKFLENFDRIQNNENK